MSLDRTAIILVLCALLPTTIVGYIAYQQTAKIRSSDSHVIHQHSVHEELDDLLSGIRDAETSVRGYIITGKDEFLSPYLTAVPKINDYEKRLSDSIADEPEQRQRLESLEPLIQDKMDHMAKILLLRKQDGFDAAKELISIGQGRQMMDKIRTLVIQMQEAEDHYATAEEAEAPSEKSGLLRVSIILGVFALALVGCNVFFIRLR